MEKINRTKNKCVINAARHIEMGYAQKKIV